jgi:hypothetical protein
LEVLIGGCWFFPPKGEVGRLMSCGLPLLFSAANKEGKSPTAGQFFGGCMGWLRSAGVQFRLEEIASIASKGELQIVEPGAAPKVPRQE